MANVQEMARNLRIGIIMYAVNYPTLKLLGLRLVDQRAQRREPFGCGHRHDRRVDRPPANNGYTTVGKILLSDITRTI